MLLHVVTNPPLLPSILSENTTAKNDTSNITVNPINSLTATPSAFLDIMKNLNINANNNFTTDDIDSLARQYVERKGGIITKTHNNVSPEVQHRLSCLFGYSSKSLPQILCKFFQNINYVYPFQMINKFGGDRIQFAYCLAQCNPSTLFQHHLQELWILFAFSRDYMLSFPLDQRKFKARTWHKARFKPKDDEEFLEIPPDDFIEIRETLCESSKEDAKLYLEDIYKMIIRWCNDDSTITDSDSDNLSLDGIDKGNKDIASNSSSSSCETDLNIYRTKKMDRE